MLRDPVPSWVQAATGGGYRRVPARRSLWAFAALALGLLAGRHLPHVDAAVWFSCACGAVSLGLLWRGRACAALLMVAAVLFGAGWFAVRIHHRAANDLSVLLGRELAPSAGGGPAAPLIVTLEGVVRDPPEPAPKPQSMFAHLAFTRDQARFTLDVYAIGQEEQRRCRGIVSVRMDPDAASQIGSGDIIRVTGRFRGVAPPVNPGEPDWRLWAAQEGRVGSLEAPGSAGAGSLVQVAGVEAPAGAKVAALWRRVVGGVRERAREALLDRADDPAREVRSGREVVLAAPATTDDARALLGALLLGRREAPDPDIDDAFTRLGLLHVLAISGFHLAVLATGVMFVVRLTGDHARLEPILVAAVVLVYLVMVPAETPVIRSGVMVLSFLAAETMARRYDRLTLLGWIAVGVLLWRPLDLWNLGFQLSFGVTGALLWLAGYTRDRLFGFPLRGVVQHEPAPSRLQLVRGPWRWAVSRIKDVTSASLLAWGVASPAIVAQTGLVSFAAPIASVVVLPLVLVILWLGYIALLAGMLSPESGPLADAAAAIVAAVVHLAEWWVRLTLLMDQAPLTSVRLGRVSAWWGLAATVAVVYWFLRGRVRDWRGWSSAAVIIVWLGLELWAGSRLPRGVLFRADMLAVGDGTCILLRSEGEAVLWDCGSRRVDVGRRVISRAVRELGALRVRTVVITHPNLDHYSALPDVIEPLGVERVLMTEWFATDAQRPGSATWMLLEELQDRGVEVVIVGAGDQLVFGDVRIDLLHPRAGVTYDELNDTSLVGLVRVPVGTTEDGPQERTMLLTGDIQQQAIGMLMATRSGLDVDAMELPHHGSATAGAVEFVRWLQPEVVLQSTGPSRVGDLRWLEVRGGRDWLVTAVDGACFVEFHSDGRVRSGATGP